MEAVLCPCRLFKTYLHKIYYIDQLCTPSFPIEMVNTEGKSLD